MRNAEFNVHPDVIVEFVEELTSRNLSNSLTGTTEDGEIIIEVEYDKTESNEVDELEEILEKLSNQMEDEQEECDGE
jgi:capsular polysaccharide biosynthesis protein